MRKNINHSFLFDTLLRAIVRSGDVLLAMQYQKQQMKNRLLNGLEQEQFIDAIADKVISKLQITVDASDIVNKIYELDDAINKLGKN